MLYFGRVNTYMKKAQDFSLKIVMIAVISLIVLIILLSMFTGKINFFKDNIKDCASKGGTCREQGECETYQILSAATCSEGEDCCMEVPI